MPDRPNILIFMTEQHRGDCLSIEGHPVLMTPNMDEIAGAGVRFSRRKELLAVYAVSAVGLLWHQAALYAGVETLGMNVYVAKIGAIALVFFWNFFLRKHFVFAPAARKP